MSMRNLQYDILYYHRQLICGESGQIVRKTCLKYLLFFFICGLTLDKYTSLVKSLGSQFICLVKGTHVRNTQAHIHIYTYVILSILLHYVTLHDIIPLICYTYR